MKAEEARELVKKFEEYNLNYIRSLILEKIKYNANKGCKTLLLDFLYYDAVTENDYKFFEDLGYKVERHEVRIFIPYQAKLESFDLELSRKVLKYEKIVENGVISWE